MKRSFKLENARKVRMNSGLFGSVEVIFGSSLLDKPIIISKDSKDDDEKCLIDENSYHFYKKNFRKDR